MGDLEGLVDSIAQLRRAAMTAGKVEPVPSWARDMPSDVCAWQHSQRQLKLSVRDRLVVADAPADEVRRYCHRCSGTGLVDGAPCAATRAEQSAWLVTAAGIPGRYIDARPRQLSDSIRRSINETAKKGVSRGLWLRGGYGIGKSHAMAALALLAAQRGVSVRFVAWDDLTVTLKDTWGKRDDSEGDVIRRLIDWPELLILDDVPAPTKGGDVVQYTAHEAKTLAMVIDRRYRSSGALCCSSNGTIDALARSLAAGGEHAAHRTASRLCEMCEGVEMKGKDRRLR